MYDINAQNLKKGKTVLKKLSLFIVLSLALLAFDKSVPNGKIVGTSDCPHCGMKITKFYKTSMAVEYKDGKKEHFCSVSCLSKALKKHKNIKKIYAVDASNGKLIDAKNAIYLINSKIAPTMNSRCVAFASKTSAKKFQKEYGGKITSFSIAIK